MPSPYILLADGEGGWVAAGIVAVIAAVGAFMRGRKEDQSKERRDTLNEVYELLDHQAKDREEDRKTIHELRDKLHAAELKLAVCEIQHAETGRQLGIMSEALKRAGITVDLRPSAPTGTSK